MNNRDKIILLIIAIIIIVVVIIGLCNRNTEHDKFVVASNKKYKYYLVPYKLRNTLRTGLVIRNDILTSTQFQVKTSYLLTLSSDVLQLLPGSSSSFIVSLQNVDGRDRKLTLIANRLPLGVKAEFSQNPITSTSIVTLTSNLTVRRYTFSFDIIGSSSDEFTTLPVTLIVSEEGNFQMQSVSNVLNLKQGSITESNLSIKASKTFKGAIEVSTQNLPYGVTAEFKSGSDYIQMSLIANTDAAVGEVDIIIVGQSNNITSCVLLKLNVVRGDALTSEQMISSVSNNWAGYIVADSLKSPTAGSCTCVRGVFTIPNVFAAPVNTPFANASIWVGIDGAFDTNPTVQQLGIDLYYEKGLTMYAWFEMYPKAATMIKDFPLSAGDIIELKVQVSSVSGKDVIYLMTINNMTKNVSFDIPTSYTTTTNSARKSAQWIVESPSMSQEITSLCAFTPCVWRQCDARINGEIGTIREYPAEKMIMISDNSTKALTSDLTADGRGFTVTWNGP
jgi:hypothetical protein